MAEYTIVNLREVEDQAPRFGYAPQLQSRFARVPLETAQSGLSFFSYAPGVRMPFGHLHTQQEEVYVVLSGHVRAKVGDDVVELDSMDALRVSPGVMRQLESGAEGAELIAFGAPNTDNKDIEMKPGWWSE